MLKTAVLYALKYSQIFARLKRFSRLSLVLISQLGLLFQKVEFQENLKKIENF